MLLLLAGWMVLLLPSPLFARFAHFALSGVKLKIDEEKKVKWKERDAIDSSKSVRPILGHTNRKSLLFHIGRSNVLLVRPSVRRTVRSEEFT